MKKILEYAKAIAALVGSVVTGLLALGLPQPWNLWLTIVGVVATTVATWAIPNAMPAAAKPAPVPPVPPTPAA